MYNATLQAQLQEAMAARHSAEREQERLSREAEALRKELAEAQLRATDGKAEQASETEQRLRTRLREEADALREAQVREAELVLELEEAFTAVKEVQTEAEAAKKAAQEAEARLLVAEAEVERLAAAALKVPPGCLHGLLLLWGSGVADQVRVAVLRDEVDVSGTRPTKLGQRRSSTDNQRG